MLNGERSEFAQTQGYRAMTKITFAVVTFLGLVFAAVGILQGPFGAALGTLAAAYSAMMWTWVLNKPSNAAKEQKGVL